MRIFFPLLLCAALFPFNAQAEDAPLPFDVPSAAPVIQRTAVVSKPVVNAAPPARAQQTKSSAHKRATNTSRSKKTTNVSIAKKQKAGRAPVVAKKPKSARSSVAGSKTRVTQSKKATPSKHATKAKVATHKKRSTRKVTHKKP